jgi:UDP-N-acetylglucosamine 2-epimerase (non-hydrolysing)
VPVSARFLVVFGTRPEAIKLAPVIHELKRHPGVETQVVSTGQHREVLEQTLQSLDVRTDLDLAVMTPAQRLDELTSKVLCAVGRLLTAGKPDVVIVQGDTTSAFATALAAFYEQVPVAHVEAGLRTADSTNPFPEELNRRLLSRLATWHFAPTPRAKATLIGEGLDPYRIWVTGNTGIDTLHWVIAHGRGRSAFTGRQQRRLLVTMHRRESQGRTMAKLAASLVQLADQLDLEVVLPLHPSPEVRRPLLAALSQSPVRVVDPLPYVDFVATLADADLVVTDSGGVQEEAPTLGTPALVVRDTTERVEGIEAGVACLVGTDGDALIAGCRRLLSDVDVYAAMARRVSPYGDGHAAERIVRQLTTPSAITESESLVAASTVS